MKLYLLEWAYVHDDVYEQEWNAHGIVATREEAEAWVALQRLLPHEERIYSEFTLGEIFATPQEAHHSNLWKPRSKEQVALTERLQRRMDRILNW